MEPRPLVTLTTDFGTDDGYVGTMKGVILGIAPDAQLVDISHTIAPQNVRQAAYVLYSSYAFFPPHTVHLAVVDPGVGSERRPMALRTRAGTFVGPDNGLFSYVMAREPVEACVALADSRYHLPHVSHTFHGRDVFSPAAAHLAAGEPVSALGPPIPDPIVFPPPRLDVAPGTIAGEVLHIDRFGNLITSIGKIFWDGDDLLLDSAFGSLKQDIRFGSAQAEVSIAGERVGHVRRTYAEVESGEMLALVGSSGHLEIAMREAHAARGLALCEGDEVVLRF